MLRANFSDPAIPSIGDEVYFCRYKDGWLGPAVVKTVYDHGGSVIENGSVKLANFNLIRWLHNTNSPVDTRIDLDQLYHDDEAIHISEE